MKSTGIVRKVDELGRIVLPIELRRTMNIDVKDAMEEIMRRAISIAGSGGGILRYRLWSRRRGSHCRHVSSAAAQKISSIIKEKTSAAPVHTTLGCTEPNLVSFH